MTAYVIVDINVIDPIGYEDYKRLAPASLKLYEAKYLVRGGSNETLECKWCINQLVF